MPNDRKLNEQSDTEQLVTLLGTTENPQEAGFILPDGRLLHLQRKSTPKRINHLDAFKLLPRFQCKDEPVSDTEMMSIMSKEGLIRFSIEGTIHTAIQPTSIQMRKMYKLLAYRSSIFEIIVSNTAGMTLEQHQVAGPSMATLVAIFNIYQNQTTTVKADEFVITQNETHYQLTFRPSQAVVGTINKNSMILKIEREYKGASKLFYKLISEAKNNI